MKNTNIGTALPSWLRVTGDEEEVEVPLGSSNSTRTPQPNQGYVHLFLRIATILLCLLMMITAIIGIEYINDVESSGKLFVATYMIFFSSLLLSFEIIQIYPVEWLDHLVRRNFGFLYGTMGKSLYIVFIAFLSFGLGDPTSLTYTTGTIWALFGLLELAIYLKYPEYFEPEEQ